MRTAKSYGATVRAGAVDYHIALIRYKEWPSSLVYFFLFLVHDSGRILARLSSSVILTQMMNLQMTDLPVLV